MLVSCRECTLCGYICKVLAVYSLAFLFSVTVLVCPISHLHLLSQQLFRYHRDYERSLNIEELLELDASAPVGVRHLVPEVHLQGVDGVASQHRHDLPVVVEVTTIHDRAIIGDLDGDVAVGSPGERYSFLVGLDRLDNAQFEVLNKHRDSRLEKRSEK